MTDFSKYQEALLPIYQMTEPNQPITLYEGKIEVVQGTQRASGNGKVQFKWLPTPLNRFEVELTGLQANQSEPIEVIPESLGVALNGTITQLLSGSKESIQGHLRSNSVIGDTNNVKTIVFHIANFLNFHGDIIAYSGKSIARRGFQQESKEFTLTVHGLEDLKNIFEMLDNVGGYGFTHIAKLEKKYGVFSKEELQNLLPKLHIYFSFLRGSYVSPNLVIGYDENRNRICEFWNAGLLQSEYRKSLKYPSWFPLDIHGLDNNLFENYMNLMGSESWPEVMSKAIAWYIESQISTFREQSIVWSQICIELLSWANFVEINQCIDKNDFKKNLIWRNVYAISLVSLIYR